MTNLNLSDKSQGILLINKPKGKTSFSLVSRLRRHLGVKKIGHAGTLDPLATGVMVMLIGRDYTRLSDKFLNEDKEYVAELKLGETTDSFDQEGEIIETSTLVPSLEIIEAAIEKFQGNIQQLPPMFSAKKVNGKKLYELARQGETVERKPVNVFLDIHLMSYNYPYLTLHVTCSKGTYIRSLAYDLGKELLCGAHLSNLQRTRSGSYRIQQCIDGALLDEQTLDKETLTSKLITY